MPSKKKTAHEKRTTLLRKWGDLDERILEEQDHLHFLSKATENTLCITNTKRRIATAQATLKRIEGKLFFGKEAIGE